VIVICIDKQSTVVEAIMRIATTVVIVTMTIRTMRVITISTIRRFCP